MCLEYDAVLFSNHKTISMTCNKDLSYKVLRDHFIINDYLL